MHAHTHTCVYRRAALQKWKEKNGFMASYKNLILAFLKAGKGNCAEAVCKVMGRNTKVNTAGNCDLNLFANLCLCIKHKL